MAVVTEYMHTATLLHDDVVDLGNMRGTSSANVVFGNSVSIWSATSSSLALPN
jgi:octaprenyl-diphosphate synthase